MRLFEKKPRPLSAKKQRKLNESLFHAATYGQTETARMLMEAGANVNAYNNAALELAVFHFHTDTVRLLIAAGAKANAGCWRFALERGADIVRALLAASAEDRIRNEAALHKASVRGHTEVVRVLAQHIFAPERWRGRSRAEIEAAATALYKKLQVGDGGVESDRLRETGKILADCAIDCWHDVRPVPPLRIGPAATPKPV